MVEKTHLGSFIRECRNGLKYTSREVSRLSHARPDIPSISNSYLISVENGKHIPRLDKVIALADLLNVPITHLVDRCREDLGRRIQAPDQALFEELFSAGRERAEMNDHAKALDLLRQAYDAAGGNSGQIVVEAGQFHELRLQIANCYRSLKINRAARDEVESLLRDRALSPGTRARAAFVLAELYRDEGNAFLGLTVAKEALRLAREVGDSALEAKLLSTLGNLAADEGSLDEALGLYRDAAIKMKALGHDRSALLARTRQGLLLVEKREFFKAIDLLRTELVDCQQNDPFVRGWLHIGLAKAYFGAENIKSCRGHSRSARDCAEKLENPTLLFLSVYYLWQVARREHAADAVAMYLERLKYYRNKMDVGINEVEVFDRLTSDRSPNSVPRNGATA